MPLRSADNKAHDQRSECSDGGMCNLETGQCECGDLFHGAACEYMICPGGVGNACHGNGRCEEAFLMDHLPCMVHVRVYVRM